MRENLKNKHSYNINRFEDPLMHKAEGPSNYFFSTLSHIIKLSR